jgi:lipoate-protein ligase A
MAAVLELWIDAVGRDGFANMAVDEWLLETVSRPLLRVYRWAPGWGSFGYFVPDAEAAESLAGLKRVRRWTGGGIVDHRADWTFTLAVPARDWLAGMKGAASYREIHAALAAALTAAGHDVRLAAAAAPARGGDCFTHAVEHDLVDARGRKLAGGGQRRSRDGLLHQGSVAPPHGAAVDFSRLGRDLAQALAAEVETVAPEPPDAEIARRVEARYGRADWARRR